MFEEFWSILAPVVGGSVHNFRYLNAEKANDAERSDVAQAGTPRANQKTVARKGHGKSPRPCKSSLIEVMQGEKMPEPPLEPAPAKKVSRRKELPPPQAFNFRPTSHSVANNSLHPKI